MQDRASLILQAIWEPEFRDCSYGFRPGCNAHQALKRVAEIIAVERTQWLVKADIKGFFDHVTHSRSVAAEQLRLIGCLGSGRSGTEAMSQENTTKGLRRCDLLPVSRLRPVGERVRQAQAPHERDSRSLLQC